MITLPISGQQARWRPSNGDDDIALADSPPGLAGAVDYVSRCVSVDASLLPVGDLDLLVVARRRELRGDTLLAEGRCAQCAAAVDVQLSLAAYVDHHRPRSSRSAVATTHPATIAGRTSHLSLLPPSGTTAGGGGRHMRQG